MIIVLTSALAGGGYRGRVDALRDQFPYTLLLVLSGFYLSLEFIKGSVVQCGAVQCGMCASCGDTG